MKTDPFIHFLDYLGLKRPLSWLYFHLHTFGLPKVRPKIIRILQHDCDAYTQGLTFHHKQLYESTGLVGASRLRKLDHHNGAVQQEIRIENEWCEGIAVLEDNLVQLTYTSGRAFVYDPITLKKRKFEFKYTGEGWGLTCCGNGYIMSNGTNELTFRNKQFVITTKLPITIKGKPLKSINDIEYVNNRTFANVQFDKCIYEIDCITGKVLRVIDCRKIVAQSGRRNYQDMLNGIAYFPKTRTFYITGKNWPTLFEIQIP